MKKLLFFFTIISFYSFSQGSQPGNGIGTIGSATIVSQAWNNISTTTPTNDVTTKTWRTGAVGIGTNNPSGKLHIVGDVYITGGSLIPSDSTLKTDIHQYESGLNELMQINTYTYRYKEDLETLRVGVIAQEVREAEPLLVVENNDGKLAVRQDFIPILINCIKEQQKQIDELKKQVKVMLKE